MVALNGYEKPAKPKCEAKIVCGGGKKAKRRGDTAAKWHCRKCGFSEWLSESPHKVCERSQQRKSR